MAIQQTRRAIAPAHEIETAEKSSLEQRDREYLDMQRQRASEDTPEQRLAAGLGWFSIGLGVTQILAPKDFARMIGAEGKHTNLIRVLCGMREITAGVGILTNRRPANWLWARVAGDAMDLALLGAALSSRKADKGRLTAAASAVAGVMALDIYNAQKLSMPPGAGGAMTAVLTKTVNRPPEELYRFWRNFENLPRFMTHLESVQTMSDKRSHWKARAPLGSSVEWDAEIVEDRPNEFIAWRSLEGADVDNSGWVRFDRAPGGRGTEVRVQIEYNPPGGALGAGVAKLFGEAPEQQIKGDLRRFKQVMETGEVVHSDASIHRGMHPAKPPEGDAITEVEMPQSPRPRSERPRSSVSRRKEQ
ncbi:MAG TPA: SRPBCC family protein [Blastocatellia bacterium]|nr:SRPBCC family protein [Blastocatellia bacterium]